MSQKQNSNQCSGDCTACTQANSCDDPRNKQTGLPERVKMNVKHVILILSGKGGVGKSTVAANLAMALSGRGYSIGLADLDIHGPSIPKMMGIEDKKLTSLDGKKIDPVRITGNLSVVSMAFLLPERSTPVIWRGPMKMTAIRQFLEDVNWGDLDYLVVDLPPGTGDEALSIAQLAPNIEGAVVVTTPQDVAVLDSSKAVKFVEKIGLKNLGIVENMSGMVCPHCGVEIDLFGKGGGKKAAEELNVPFLGAIPLDPAIRQACDEGRPFILRRPGMDIDNPTWKATDAVVDALINEIEG